MADVVKKGELLPGEGRGVRIASSMISAHSAGEGGKTSKKIHEKKKKDKR